MTNGQFSCDVEPIAPTQDELSAEGGDNKFMNYIIDLQDSGQDCRDELLRVKNFLEVNGITVTDVLISAQKPRKRFGIF